MKLRIPSSSGAADAAMQAPQLSPDGHSWCQLDAGGVIATSPHAVVLTGAHKDQVDGLLDLRRGSPINLYATPAVFEHLTQALPLLPVLEQYCGVQWHLIAVAGDSRQTDFTIAEWPTLQFTAMTLGAAPSGERIALAVHDTATDRRLFVAPASTLSLADLDWLHGADCLLLSGPLPSAAGPATHWLDLIAELAPQRKILLHAAADEADDAALAERGIERARAGMEVEL
jgi:pyrroloquinoline quinone biosynthesis protein B